MPYFHVSSVLNRASIDEHGLDGAWMSTARGIAGSQHPEAEGVFLCRSESERDWFVRFINMTGGPVDVWEVADVDPADLVDNGSGNVYLPGTIARSRIALVERDLPVDRPETRRLGT